MTRTLFTILLLCFAYSSWSELPSLSPYDPKIIIRHGNNKTIYEYRINGELIEIKIVPKLGKPYYLVPAGSGDGTFTRIESSALLVPSWTVHRW